MWESTRRGERIGESPGYRELGLPHQHLWASVQFVGYISYGAGVTLVVRLRGPCSQRSQDVLARSDDRSDLDPAFQMGGLLGLIRRMLEKESTL